LYVLTVTYTAVYFCCEGSHIRTSVSAIAATITCAGYQRCVM